MALPRPRHVEAGRRRERRAASRERRHLTPVALSNAAARALLIERAGLADAPASRTTSVTLLRTIERLGMVQLDPLAPVARAHDHILWSRHVDYRPARLDTLLSRRREVYEHFTHDAAILPVSLWPWWSRARRLRAERYARGSWGSALPDEAGRAAVLARIRDEGPLCSADFDGPPADRSVHAWMRPPHKIALEWAWLAGTLAVSGRKRFAKYYDLVERVLPAQVLAEQRDEDAQVERLCEMALERLGVATPGEIKRFWEACSLDEVQAWLRARGDELEPVRIACADGSAYRAIAPAGLAARAERDAAARAPGTRTRVLNPFDPLVRDRARLKRVFGFDYRIEIYVPEAKRRYGWYVYPVLEGTRFIGRLEARVDRDADRLRVTRWWPEPHVATGKARTARIERELQRLARFAGASACDALPPQSAPSQAMSRTE